MQEDVRAEEAFLDHRRKLYGDLRSAESNEVAAAEKRLVDERAAEQALVEEREQARFARRLSAPRWMYALTAVQAGCHCGSDRGSSC